MTTKEMFEAQSAALRRLAGVLEAVAGMLETAATEERAPTVVVEPMVPTRKMPSMEEHARALDEAVRQAAGIPRKID